MQAQLTKSFANCGPWRSRPPVRQPDPGSRRPSFLKGDDWAYAAGVVAVLLGAALVAFMFPKHDDEEALLVTRADGQATANRPNGRQT